MVTTEMPFLDKRQLLLQPLPVLKVLKLTSLKDLKLLMLKLLPDLKNSQTRTLNVNQSMTQLMPRTEKLLPDKLNLTISTATEPTLLLILPPKLLELMILEKD